MLQPKHLAIVRAALMYWDEEMAGADQTAYQHYLHSRDMGVKIDSADVIQARQFFSSVRLCDPATFGIGLPESSAILISAD